MARKKGMSISTSISSIDFDGALPRLITAIKTAEPEFKALRFALNRSPDLNICVEGMRNGVRSNLGIRLNSDGLQFQLVVGTYGGARGNYVVNTKPLVGFTPELYSLVVEHLNKNELLTCMVRWHFLDGITGQHDDSEVGNNGATNPESVLQLDRVVGEVGCWVANLWMEDCMPSPSSQRDENADVIMNRKCEVGKLFGSFAVEIRDQLIALYGDKRVSATELRSFARYHVKLVQRIVKIQDVPTPNGIPPAHTPSWQNGMPTSINLCPSSAYNTLCTILQSVANQHAISVEAATAIANEFQKRTAMPNIPLNAFGYRP